MSNHIESLPPNSSELDEYPTAALLAVRARLDNGHATTYDRFLCDYVGEPRYGSPHFRPIAQTALSGMVYHYNNPLNRHSSYTREGTMLEIRGVQGRLNPGDESSAVFVATADLRTETMTEWRVTSINRVGYEGQELSLETGEPELFAVDAAEGQAGYPDLHALDQLLARRQHTFANTARLVLSPGARNLFIPPVGADEVLDTAVRLVSDVNYLTERLQIDLTSRRQAAAQQLATILPFTRAAA